MEIVQLIDEDFVNYKKPCMVIGMPKCNFKCDKECGMPVCQNSKLASAPIITVDPKELIDRYLNNPITKAICFQGLEPIESWAAIVSFMKLFREVSQDDIVIYTGFTEEEISWRLDTLKEIGNIIVKFGRFVPGQQPHRDDILGVDLVSDNQYAKKIL